MGDIAAQLGEIRRRMAAACDRSGREVSAVELIAVSKTFPAEAVREAIAAGHDCFGESRWQEADPKMELLPGHLHWHFIGRLQRNKLRKILPRFEVLHAVDSMVLARAINDLAHELGLFPKVFIQVNIGGEASKGGFDPADLRATWPEISDLDRIEILGLMCIPPIASDPEAARPYFVAMRQLREALEADGGLPVPALSMGMSDDFEVAIEEGATHVRVGSAIFGKRSYRVDGELA